MVLAVFKSTECLHLECGCCETNVHVNVYIYVCISVVLTT